MRNNGIAINNLKRKFSLIKDKEEGNNEVQNKLLNNNT